MRVRLLAATGLTAALVLLGAAPAAAQDPAQDPVVFVGRQVAAVTLEVDGQPDTTPALLALLAVKPGAPFRLEDEDASIHRLVATGGFIEVSVAIVDRPDRTIDVIFRALPLHPVDRLEFAADTGLPPDDLRTQVTERLGRLFASVTPERVRQTLLDVLADEGFHHADADVEVIRRHGPERSTYRFVVTAGTRAQIAEVTIVNDSPVSDGTLAARTGAVRGLPYRSRAIGNAVAVIGDELRAKKYFAAQASVVGTEIAPDRYALALTVTTGPLVVLRWAKDGDAPPRGDLTDFVPVARFETVDDDLLEDSRARIEATLKNAGYKNAVVTLTKETPPGQLIVTYKVTRGPRFLIATVEIPQGLAIPPAELQGLLALPSGEPLNLQQVVDGQRRIVAEYRRRGYYRADARFGDFRDLPPVTHGDVPTVLPLIVDEGPRGLVSRVELERETTQVPETALRAVIRSRAGDPFLEAQVAADQYALAEEYLNRGFRASAVGAEIVISDDGAAITVRFKITEGPLVRVADIQVVGNENVSEARIRERLTLREGEPFGEARRLESRDRLQRMGVFRRVEIAMQTSLLPGDDRAHVIVTVLESPGTTFGIGGGVEAAQRSRATAGGGREDQVVISPRGFFELGRRNLGGHDRAVNFFSRLSLRPKEVSSEEEGAPGSSFSEYRVTFTFNERRAFDSDTDLLFGVTSEQAIRTGFTFLRRAVNAEGLRRITPRLNVSGRYALDFTRLFDEQIKIDDRPLIDRRFPQVRLSLLGAGLLWDRRSNALDPGRGTLSSADVEFASRHIGSEVGYVKMLLQSSLYHAITRSGRVVVAGRAEVGVARGYPRTVFDEAGNPEVVEDLPASQRFYAGGSTSVRGFAIDRLGVPEIFDPQGLSKGGNGLLVLNAELRTTVGQLFGRTLSMVQFLDGGNVYARAGDIDLGRIRRSVGFGVRYDSPLGPIRLDFGFKLDRQRIAGTLEKRWAYHLNFGQAF